MVWACWGPALLTASAGPPKITGSHRPPDKCHACHTCHRKGQKTVSLSPPLRHRKGASGKKGPSRSPHLHATEKVRKPKRCLGQKPIPHPLPLCHRNGASGKKPVPRSPPPRHRKGVHTEKVSEKTGKRFHCRKGPDPAKFHTEKVSPKRPPAILGHEIKQNDQASVFARPFPPQVPRGSMARLLARPVCHAPHPGGPGRNSHAAETALNPPVSRACPCSQPLPCAPP